MYNLSTTEKYARYVEDSIKFMESGWKEYFRFDHINDDPQPAHPKSDVGGCNSSACLATARLSNL